MINTKFEAYKLQRELVRNGKDFVFFRSGQNNFGEPSGEASEVSVLMGLYHETTDYIQVGTQDTTQVRTNRGGDKKQSYILCLYSKMQEAGIQIGDFTMINGKKYKVNGVINVQQWNIIADISLEVIDDGHSVQL
jgi:hypothetical protein